MAASPARRLWEGIEPIHCVVYFAPEAASAYADIGLKGYWMGYFASRAAALGPVPASVVQAIFYNFAPRMVERAIPDAWTLASPEAILQARREIAGAAMQRLLSDHDDVVGPAASLAARLASALPVEGRPLSAAHAALEWPFFAQPRLWHAATLLREHRADGHFSALLAEGIDGCEALVLQVAAGQPHEALAPHRGWTDEEWSAARVRLRERGLVDEDGALTDAGVALRQHVDRVTDDLALPRSSPLSDEEMEELIALAHRVRRVIDASSLIPYPNPMVLARAEELRED